MAPIALINADIYVAGHDMTGETNKVMLSGEINELDSTTFGSNGWRERAAGLRDVKASAEGFWASATNGDAVDPESFANLGVMDRVFTVSATGVEAQTCYFSQFGEFAYSMDGEIGELFPFTLGWSGSNKQGLVRGQLAKTKGTVSATGALGSACQLGAVGANQSLYGTLHVLGTPGTTITVVLESDADNTFASATTQATFNGGAITAAGGFWAARTAGPLTDTWYRLRVTAITGTFTIAGAIGIGA